MDLTQTIDRITKCMPGAGTPEILRMAMLVYHRLDAPTASDERLEFESLVQELALQLAVHEDQHAAIAEELDGLANTAPCDFSTNHLWTLVRAIKVQSQYLHLFLGPQACQPSS